MTEAERRLIGAAEEALAIAEGNAKSKTYRIHVPATVDVRAIRKSLKLTQSAFGEQFGFGLSRVRDWEQGRTSPDTANRAFLTVIQHAPEVVVETLAQRVA